MTQQSSAASPAQRGVTDAKHATDPKLATSFAEYLRDYQPAAPSGGRDLLNGHYRINLSSPLPAFNTRTATAYAAADLQDPELALVALVCEKGTAQRHYAIQQLLASQPPSMLALHAAGIVLLSQPAEERFVIIHARPKGKKLSALLAEITVSLSNQFIIEHVIAPLASAIDGLNKLGISHGRMHPDNIYFTDTATLGECVSEPCGASQPFYLEPIDRMMALPAGKGEGSTSHDCYALGVLTLYLLYGPKHFSRFTPESLMKTMFREGVYSCLIGQQDIPQQFNDFFRGVFAQNSDARWGIGSILAWLDGKRFNVLPPPAPAESARPFEFGDASIFTRRELAHVLHINWDNVASTLQTAQLAHWFTISLRKKELSEQVTRVARQVVSGSKNDLLNTEQMTRLLMLIDPAGPIRIKQMAFHIDGIHTLYAELFARNAKQELLYLTRFIELDMAGFWHEIQRSEREEFQLSYAANALLLKLEQMRSYARNSGIGFGAERILYDLNPEMPCLSPIFADQYITTLQTLVTRLDRMAPQLAGSDEPIDRHIAAFIASKLGLQHEIPSISNSGHSRALTALRLLAAAQQKSGIMNLPGLTHWLALRLLPVVEAFHSDNLRKEVKVLLGRHIKSGSVPYLAELLINEKIATADYEGFVQAQSRYQANAQRIDDYRQGKGIDEYSAKVGFAIAKSVASLAFLGTFAYVLRGLI